MATRDYEAASNLQERQVHPVRDALRNFGSEVASVLRLYRKTDSEGHTSKHLQIAMVQETRTTHSTKLLRYNTSGEVSAGGAIIGIITGFIAIITTAGVVNDFLHNRATLENLSIGLPVTIITWAVTLICFGVIPIGGGGQSSEVEANSLYKPSAAYNDNTSLSEVRGWARQESQERFRAGPPGPDLVWRHGQWEPKSK